MTHVAYVNGAYVPHRLARLSIDDRATQFADAAYEVICLWNGRPVDYAAHLARLARSLGELRIAMPFSLAALTVICREIAARNRIDRGTLYLQISRGTAPRAHPFPAHAKPSVVIAAKHGAGPSDAVAEAGVQVIIQEDGRWGRCDIKSVGLLANVMARQRATEVGSFEAVFTTADGTITEATSSNVWMVAGDGTLLTHPAGCEVLSGITRATVLRLAREAGYPVTERPFKLADLRQAREVFLTGTTTFVMPVVQVDGQVVANGVPGTIACDLRRSYQDDVGRQTQDDRAWQIMRAP